MILKVCVYFYSSKRSVFPSLNEKYSPHLVVNDDDEMLGVQFLSSDLTSFDAFGNAYIKCIYENVSYQKLKQGTEFKIFEGSQLVGKGYVLEDK